ncbi:MAG: 3-deoxy-7-phosphoheptulonate synthase, partial [Planctomycetales bacterium]
MIIILRSSATDEQIEHVLKRVESLGMKTHLSRGTFRTVVGLIGDESKVSESQLRAIPGVAQVIPVLPPYKLASIEAHPQASVVQVGNVRFGSGFVGMIAGPCSVESSQQMDAIASAICRSGANVLRGGAFKPRTSPYDFQGLGEEGLKILRETGDKYGMPVVTEVLDPRRVEMVDRYADMFQIGARNM